MMIINSFNTLQQTKKSWKNGKRSQIISKINFSINKFNWKRISYPSGKDDLKKFEKNNPKMCSSLKNKYTSCIHFKNSFNNEKQIVLLMIPNGKGWHNLTVKTYLHY